MIEGQIRQWNNRVGPHSIFQIVEFTTWAATTIPAIVCRYPDGQETKEEPDFVREHSVPVAPLKRGDCFDLSGVVYSISQVTLGGVVTLTRCWYPENAAPKDYTKRPRQIVRKEHRVRTYKKVAAPPHRLPPGCVVLPGGELLSVKDWTFVSLWTTLDGAAKS